MKNKKKFLIILTLIATFMVVGNVNAALLGIGDYAGGVPDIWYDAGGTVSYNEGTNLFKIAAMDWALYLGKPVPPGPAYSLFPNVDFNLQIYVDENGNKTGGLGGVTDLDMTETVLNGFSIVYEGVTYSFAKGDLFLGAEVTAFGWEEKPITDGFQTFDYLFGEVTGKLVDYGLWPTIAGTGLITGGYIDIAQESPDDIWGTTWSQLTEKGDKYPTPEPGSLILLGLGLLGLVGFKVRKRG